MSAITFAAKTHCHVDAYCFKTITAEGAKLLNSHTLHGHQVDALTLAGKGSEATMEHLRKFAMLERHFTDAVTLNSAVAEAERTGSHLTDDERTMLRELLKEDE